MLVVVTPKRMDQMRVCFFKVFFLIFSLAPLPLRADDPLSPILDRTAFSTEEKLAIKLVFERARAENVPMALLLPRLEEGVAKRHPAKPLAAVLEKELAALVRSRDLLTAADPAFETDDQPAVWLRATLLLNNNVAEETIGIIAVAAASRWADFRAATELFLALGRWGLDESAARRVAAAALASRLAASDFSGVAALFPRGRALLLSPRLLSERILKALPEAKTAEELKARVLY